MKALAVAAVAAGVAVLTISLVAQPDMEPARLLDGPIPVVPVLMTSGGDVIVSAAVSRTGSVTDVGVLRSTPPLTEAVVRTVRAWRFSPALDSLRRPTESRVLVDTVALAPSLYSPTVGTPPANVAAPDPRVPFPAQTQVPLYPVNARVGGTVVVEARVDVTGHVVAATTVRSAPPFDAPALEAVRSWTFRPTQSAAAPSSPYAYVVLMFRQPIVGAAPPPIPTPTSGKP